ncbi:MAG TPA: ethanolamine ammonia-lyase reactivating factor EutA [Planctomycetaceae bacterium]|nr:ethanolamine ammonia-lyase reactivating factor EutA [Planctomycetaceae bacterium]
MTSVRLVGLDFGTTTSRCVAATARLSKNAVTGRQELSDIREVFRSPIVLTPFGQDRLDLRRLEEHLDDWLSAAAADTQEIFGGGALVTGLAAQQPNSSALVELIRSRVKDLLVATAGDPCLEAWLAFQANAGSISRARPDRPDRWVINLDIGGGTTNIAVGRSGEVLRTGSLFVGARHIEVEPGTYRIVKLSRYARAMLDDLAIAVGPGDRLTSPQLDAILDWQMELLESALAGDRAVFEKPVARLHEQVAFHPPSELQNPIVCLSGGVGELVYKMLRSELPPSTTQFGDLGIDLAARIAKSRWKARPTEAAPLDAGRATVYGLLLYATQVSGSTVYLADSAVLPMRDVPILGRITDDSTDAEIQDILQLASRSAVGGCVVVSLAQSDGQTVRTLGERIGSTLRSAEIPAATRLVLLVRENVGKALGGYLSQWGSVPHKLVVLDEIEPLDARFVQIGALRDQVVPISFYGMN